MDINKGRFAPNTRSLSWYYEPGARPPYEGEICIDRATEDIIVWQKDERGIWHKVSRTAAIQELLDGYGSKHGDGLFINAMAFYQAGVIHRLFFNQADGTIWLDDSLKSSYRYFKYYAVKSISKDMGKRRYVTGLVDSDGTDAEKALIPIGEVGKLTKELFPGTQYVVEFYDNKKELLYDQNFIATSSDSKPFDIAYEYKKINANGDEVYDTNTVTNARLEFNQMDENGNAYLNVGQNPDELIPMVVLTHADGHESYYRYGGKRTKYDPFGEEIFSIDYDKFFNCRNKDLLDSSNPGEFKYEVEFYLDPILFVPIDTLTEEKLNIKHIITWKNNKFTAEYNNVKEPVKITVEKQIEWNKRVYKSVKVKRSGDTEWTTVPTDAYSIDSSNEYCDEISISHIYFGTGINQISVSYTEESDVMYVNVNPLKVNLSKTIYIREKPVIDLQKFFVVGRVNSNSANPITLDFFGLFEDGYIRNVTEDVRYIKKPIVYNYGELNDVAVEVYGNTYSFTVFCLNKDVGVSQRVLINKTEDNEYNVMYGFNNKSSLQLASHSETGDRSITAYDLLTSDDMRNVNGRVPTYLRVRSIRLGKYITDFVQTDEFTFKPKTQSIYPIKIKEDTLVSDIENNLGITLFANSEKLEHTLRVMVNVSALNKSDYTTKTLREILDNGSKVYSKEEYANFENQKSFVFYSKPDPEDYEFVGYSLDGFNPIEPEELDVKILPHRSKRLFAIYDKKIELEDTIPEGFIGSLVVYQVQRGSIVNNEPLLVEGYYKNSEGKMIACGARTFYIISKNEV